MAIQKIDDALPNGDTPRKINEKINENFSNEDHAASKLVGTGAGRVVLSENIGEVAFRSSKGTSLKDDESLTTLADFPNGGSHHIGGNTARFTDMPVNYSLSNLISFSGYNNSKFQIFHGYSGYASGMLYMRSGKASNAWLKIYHDKNTTIENGYLKPSSPVLRLRHDSFIKEHEAEQLDIRVDNPKKGVYKVIGTTGLRKDDGWYFTPPKDEHMNVLCFVEVEEQGDTITVKTYTKKFDFETVSIVPDYDNPIDIPDSGDLLLRFNDLSEEELEEPVMEEELEPEEMEEPIVEEVEEPEEEPKG